MTRDYDSTVARIAGNILCGMLASEPLMRSLAQYPGSSVVTVDADRLAIKAVELARAIVAETKRTEGA